MILEKYHKLFQAQVQVLDEVGVTIEDESLVVSIMVENSREVPNKNDQMTAKNQAWSYVSFMGPTHNIKGIYIACGICIWMG